MAAAVPRILKQHSLCSAPRRPLLYMYLAAPLLPLTLWVRGWEKVMCPFSHFPGRFAACQPHAGATLGP